MCHKIAMGSPIQIKGSFTRCLSLGLRLALAASVHQKIHQDDERVEAAGAVLCHGAM